jgi:gliding motility-associated-like protein
MASNGNFEYSIDGSSYQSSNSFTNLEAGLYTVYVHDPNGCGTATGKVLLLMYPNFFTPNNDGFHDTWRIEYGFLEPNLQVYIYDRYGKLLTAFNGKSKGWDGRYNGEALPSTDYWFVVQRQDGREYKGHFSMLR